MVRIIAKSTLRAFWAVHPDAEEPLLAWYREVEKEDWSAPAHGKENTGRRASEGHGWSNIKGNDYRLVVRINYPYRILYVRFVGTHAGYDRINVEEV